MSNLTCSPKTTAAGAYYGPHETRTGYPVKTRNGNAMAYDAGVGKALWEASEKAMGNRGPEKRYL